MSNKAPVVFSTVWGEEYRLKTILVAVDMKKYRFSLLAIFATAVKRIVFFAASLVQLKQQTLPFQQRLKAVSNSGQQTKILISTLQYGQRGSSGR